MAKRVQEIEHDEDWDEVDVPFLGEVTNNKEYWSAVVTLDGHPCEFKLDTGAEVTILSDKDWSLKKHKLTLTKQNLGGPGGTKLEVLGSFEGALEISGRKHKETVYVLKNQASSLLSKRACEALDLLRTSKEVYEVNPTETPNFKAEFPELFTGLGRFKEECRITLREGASPMCLYTARKVPHPLLPQVEKELKSMVEQGVISPVTEPTQWCSGMVPVPKSNGRVRICVDLTSLNKAVVREIHPMKSVDENLAKLRGSSFYSKLDANSGFWQIPLNEHSQLLTTFISPFGRFCFNRLPFGISSAPEIFQRMMSSILIDLEGHGVICHMDDVLIYGQTEKEHDSRVRTVLQRMKDAGMTLNEKCEFSKKKIQFLGHILSSDGIQADPAKISAILDYPPPTNITELQRFNGMVNQLAKFMPGLAKINEPLRQLLKKDTVWRWDKPQQKAFEQVKRLLVSPDTLAHYDPNRPTTIAADASGHGLGAVLLQTQENGIRRAVAAASRSLNETEQRYATIEKEALAATWACDKFCDYVLGLKFKLETDHKPLVPLLSSTDLAKMPPRILRFRLRMMRFNPEVIYVPGKNQVTADALSRAPVHAPDAAEVKFILEVEVFASKMFSIIPASEARLQTIREAQAADAECTQVVDYCQNGWPAYQPLQPLLRPYWENKSHLTIQSDLLLFDNRLVIPRSQRLTVLQQIHEGHLGINKCRARAQGSVWWPFIGSAIEEMVKRCHTCAKLLPEPKQPLMPSEMPSHAWERVGTDLFEFNKKMYLLIVDYYSRWIEVRHLPNSQTAGEVITAMKSVFGTHGIPDIVISDNGPQYASESFKLFAQQYGFTHNTSSPLYPQANGAAERAVRTVKNILKKNEDPYLGLLAHRSTPLYHGLSPSQLLMGKKLRTTLPVPPNQTPTIVDQNDLQDKESEYREKQALNYNKRHRVVTLPALDKGDQVWIRDQDRYGQVVERSNSPRSYIIKTTLGTTVRRNRQALVHSGENQGTPVRKPNEGESPVTAQAIPSYRPSPVSPPAIQPENEGTPSPPPQVSRRGRAIIPPKKLDL